MVIVRVRMAIGSKIIRVRLPKIAAARMRVRMAYLAVLQRGEGPFDRLRARLARRKRIHSSTVPVGQIQPHHTRPKTRVRAAVISARPRRGIHARAASMADSAASGLKRKNRSVHGWATRPW